MVSKDQSGFTIVELMVAVSISAVASILIVTAFVYTYGSVVVEQTKSSMIQRSQVFLRRMSDDIRLGNEIRTTNQITDSYQTGGWVTSDPANILITTQPVTNASNDLIFDTNTGYPYQNEIVYFGSGGKMYRRLLANPLAAGSAQTSTCPIGTVGCNPDIELVDNLDNMVFEFYDNNDNPTNIPEDARSVEVTINLRKKVYGKDIATSNTTRITLRNEN